jgi:hypothetical protein
MDKTFFFLHPASGTAITAVTLVALPFVLN